VAMSNIFSTAFAEEKKIRKILILGPYKPPPAKERLIRLRDCLLVHGYENAKIVEDFPNIPKYDEDSDKHFTLKSRDRIKNWADVLVFVFIHEANNLGVWSELQFTLDSVKEKIHYSIELHEQGVDLSSQTRGPLKISRMYSSEFCSDRKLCDFAIAFCTNVVYEFLW
jgi:hypothetical protein